MKVRKERRDYREYIKERANRHNSLTFEHPQARREMQHHQKEINEAMTPDCDCPLYPGCQCPTCNTCEELLEGETE